MSDGCSVPKLLRLAVPLETDAQIAVCRAHDEAYYYGGSAEWRATVDATFYQGLLAAPMVFGKAALYYRAVRLFGGPRLRIKGVSWAFGGERFQYDEEPALSRASEEGAR